VQIRRAEALDVDALLPQFQVYLTFYKRQGAKDKVKEFLTQNLALERSIIFIAVDAQEKIVGFTQLYWHLSSLSMAPYIYLSDLYVDQSCRKQGIAKLLMKEAEAFGIANGATDIQLETAHTNAAAQELYESLGYKWEQDYRTYALKLPTT